MEPSMAFLALLWLPILLSAILVFFLSAASHMGVPYRVKEWAAAPEQDALQKALAKAEPGLYVFPSPETSRERGQAEWMEKWAAGPSAFLTLVPRGPINMGRNLGLSFLVNLFVSLLAAYVAHHALGGTHRYLAVFRLVGTIGFAAYAIGSVYESIWYWRPWRSIAMNVLDALAFGLAMGGVFGWLWPR
jgi:hypothetical protein